MEIRISVSILGCARQQIKQFRKTHSFFYIFFLRVSSHLNAGYFHDVMKLFNLNFKGRYIQPSHLFFQIGNLEIQSKSENSFLVFFSYISFTNTANGNISVKKQKYLNRLSTFSRYLLIEAIPYSRCIRFIYFN